MKRIVLASMSPRRKELLKKIIEDFSIISPDCDETLDNLMFSPEKIMELAYRKAFSVSKNEKDALIISADTVVVFDGMILNKPKDEEDAIQTLNALSGKTHKVVTAICVMDTETKNYKTKAITTFVTFKKLSEVEILNYVKTFKPFDKAGSYGIQEYDFAENIEGSFENVVGLCTKSVLTLLKEVELIRR